MGKIYVLKDLLGIVFLTLTLLTFLSYHFLSPFHSIFTPTFYFTPLSLSIFLFHSLHCSFSFLSNFFLLFLTLMCLFLLTFYFLLNFVPLFVVYTFSLLYYTALSFQFLSNFLTFRQLLSLHVLARLPLSTFPFYFLILLYLSTFSFSLHFFTLLYLFTFSLHFPICVPTLLSFHFHT